MELIHADATITARQRTSDLAHSAMPNAPTITEPERTTRLAGERAAHLRRGASLALRRLADRLDTQPGRTSQASGAS